MCSSLPLVSIIVPAYNAEKTILDTLDSLFLQCYSNLEIIVVDDGSTDGTSKAVLHRKLSDDRLQLVVKENGGAGDARNSGLDRARGKYVTFVDSDDLLDSNAIKVMVDAAMHFDADIVIGKHHKFVGANPERSSSLRKEYGATSVLASTSRIIELILYKKEHEGVCGNIYRRDLLKGISFPLARVYEDAFFNLVALSRAKTCSVLCEPVYWYRQRAESLTHTYNTDFDQRLLLSYEALLTNVSRRVDISNSALKYSLFCYASNLLWRIDPHHEFDMLWDMVKRSRSSVLIDSQAAVKYKVAAICSLFGCSSYRLIGKRALGIQKAEQ